MKQNLKRPKLGHGLMLLLMLLFSGFTTFSLQAQEQIKGTVLDVGGNPIPGVSILQKGTSNGVVTDFDGVYSMKIKNGQKILIFSYLGFKTQEVNVAGKAKLNVVMEDSAETLDEIVIVGYQPVKRENILGAVSGAKAADIEAATPVAALQGVQGKLSGVQILSNNGPGAGFDIRIRGLSTLTAGATGPLYVVDGQQTFDIDNLDPSDIESLDVLKDGASTAIYGARGGNGVVVIKTKSGKSGKTVLTVSHTTGINSLTGQIPVANARQRILQERVGNPNPVSNATVRDSLSQAFRQSPDSQSLVTRPALRQQYNVTLNGGGEKAKFNWNTGFLDEEGIIVNSGFKRFNTRLKLDVDANEKVKAGTVLNLSFDETNGAPAFQILNQLTRRISYFPIFEPDGTTFSPSTPTFASQNPLQQAELRENFTRNYRVSSFNYLQYKIIPDLTVKSTLGVTFRYLKNEQFVPGILSNGDFRTDPSTAVERHWLRYNFQQENILNYNKTWGKNSFAAFLGNQIQRDSSENLRVTADLVNDLVETLNNSDGGTTEVDIVGGDQTQNQNNTIFSVFSGFNYDYAGKYLIGGTIRRDASSRFGSNNQVGYFPSGNIGWKVSKESFLENNKTISNLLLRASWGIVGNERIPNFSKDDALSPGFPFALDGTNIVTGVGSTRLGNADIKWEETESINLGFDLGLFKNKLKLTTDVWRKSTNGLLVNSQIPEESGFETIIENRGDIVNQGIDFSINGTVLKKKDFTWNAGLNFSIYENEVTSLDTPIQSGRFLVEEGESIGNIVGYKNFGVFSRDESNAYTADGVRLNPNFDSNGFFLGTYTLPNGQDFTGTDVRQITRAGQPLRGGDYIWNDTDGNFEIDSEDIEVLGNGLATIYGGVTQDFKYKGFTLGLLFDYSFGNDIYRRYDHERNSLRARVLTASPDRIENAWQQQGDITEFPILRVGNGNNRFDFTNTTANSSYVTDGSFIIWRYARLGYSFPKEVLNDLGIGISNLRLNLAINNVLTWTNYEGFSPEFGSRGNPLEPSEDNLRYPSDREFLLSLRVQF